MAVSQKSSRPAGMHRTRTGAELPWYHLASPRPCGHGLACRGKTGLRAVTGAPGGDLAACRFTPTAQRPSSTPCSPARFHPSGFLSGAGGAYSPRQGCSLFAKGAHDPLVPIIIRKNGGFVTLLVKCSVKRLLTRFVYINEIVINKKIRSGIAILFCVYMDLQKSG